jgi:hypothetical protein
MPEAEQPLAESEARRFVLTTVWQGLSELADQINAKSDRIATVTVDPAAPGRISLRVYPVGSQPAQATPLFRYEVAVSSVASGPRVPFVAQPAVVNGQMRNQERGELAMPGTREGGPVTPRDVRDDVVRCYQDVLAARITGDAVPG